MKSRTLWDDFQGRKLIAKREGDCGLSITEYVGGYRVFSLRLDADETKELKTLLEGKEDPK